METLQDATYRLEDGTVYTKYDNSAFLADHHVHGMAGHGVGLWMIFPSNEFIGGGPVKQELTVHMDNVVLGMLQGRAFRFRRPSVQGGGGVVQAVRAAVRLRQPGADRWTRLWDDAKKRADAETAKWPYAWLDHKDYPREARHGRRPRSADGRRRARKGAWVILAPPGEDWTQVEQGLRLLDAGRRRGEVHAWTRSGPGRYTLFVSGADQFADFRREDVEVEAGKDTDLGELKWEPIKHGRRLWQIGVADRSSAEFKGGDDYRHYGNFLRYPKDFANDVTFVVGKSKEAEDWNFAQWSWYSKKPYLDDPV